MYNLSELFRFFVVMSAGYFLCMVSVGFGCYFMLEGIPRMIYEISAKRKEKRRAKKEKE